MEKLQIWRKAWHSWHSYSREGPGPFWIWSASEAISKIDRDHMVCNCAKFGASLQMWSILSKFPGLIYQYIYWSRCGQSGPASAFKIQSTKQLAACQWRMSEGWFNFMVRLLTSMTIFKKPKKSIHGRKISKYWWVLCTIPFKSLCCLVILKLSWWFRLSVICCVFNVIWLFSLSLMTLYLVYCNHHNISSVARPYRKHTFGVLALA